MPTLKYSGNTDLLKRKRIAFFASRNSTSQARRLALEWAEQIAHSDCVVMSGFHSPLEREVLDILLRRKCSVIVGIGRDLYHKIPPHLKDAYDDNRLLFISYYNHPRHSASNAQTRNWGLAFDADSVVFAPFDDKSSILSTLHYTLQNSSQERDIKILG